MNRLERFSPSVLRRPASMTLRRWPLRRLIKNFLLAAPTLVALLYYGIWAAPRYISETQFVVRGANSSRASGLEALFRIFGVTRSFDDANIVQQYILSRDAVIAIQKRLPLLDFFTRPEADLFSRFPRFWEHEGGEGFYSHYLWRVKVVQDSTRGVLTLRVETFRAQDSLDLARGLMSLAEEMVNSVNARALSDAVDNAQQAVAVAEQRLIDAQLALTNFRNAAVLVDPTKTSNSALETISKLANELSLTEAEVQQLLRTAPSSPLFAAARARIEALRSRIASERSGLAGDDAALAAKVSTYEKLALVRDLSDKGLASALLSLESARQEAQHQQIYIERVSGPNTPDVPLEPQRARMVFTVFVVSMMSYAVIWILTVGAREHSQSAS